MFSLEVKTLDPTAGLFSGKRKDFSSLKHRKALYNPWLSFHLLGKSELVPRGRKRERGLLGGMSCFKEDRPQATLWTDTDPGL